MLYYGICYKLNTEKPKYMENEIQHRRHHRHRITDAVVACCFFRSVAVLGVWETIEQAILETWPSRDEKHPIHTTILVDTQRARETRRIAIARRLRFRPPIERIQYNAVRCCCSWSSRLVLARSE